MHRFSFAIPTLLLGCTGPGAGPIDADTDAVGLDTDLPLGVWNPRLPATADLVAPRGQAWVRAAIHLHSPYSHDACDGQGWSPEGLDQACHQAMYEGLCATRIDLALLTDHPDHGDTVPLVDRFPDGAESVQLDGAWWGMRASCGDDPHTTLVQAGFEDTLMPVGLRTEVSADPVTRHDLLNRDDADAVSAMQGAGGRVFLAHTEGRERDDLVRLQDLGLHAIEAFNVHAAFAPDIRAEDLGLDATGWATAIGPFVTGAPGLEPDLLFLPILETQVPSLAHWDALLARGPMMATFGSDAHENVLPTLMADGERVDGYRRVLRMGTTWLLAPERSPAGVEAALDARRAFVVFELLGTPAGLDLHLDTEGGAVVEVGGEGGRGTLVVGCPTLAAGSPRGEVEPAIRVDVLKDGVVWAQGCGEHTVGPGVYRVEIHQRPDHLAPFLGEDPSSLLRYTPWVYTGAIRVVGEE